VLFGILVEVSSDFLVEDLVSLVDVGDWLVAVVLGLSLLLAEASCQLKSTSVISWTYSWLIFEETRSRASSLGL
jgi:hypothetical protein